MRDLAYRLLLLVSLVTMASACDDCDADPLGNIPDPEDQIDVFEQKQAANVDILWVVDNSESMAAEQLKIAGRFNDFFRQLLVSQVDYHIGVVTTDPDDLGQLRAYDGTTVPGCDGCQFLTKDVGCSNPDVDVTGQDPAQAEQTLLDSCHAQAVFRRLITAGIDGSAFEEGFTQAASALGADVIDPSTGFPSGTVPATNEGFLRDGASLYIVAPVRGPEGRGRGEPRLRLRHHRLAHRRHHAVARGGLPDPHEHLRQQPGDGRPRSGDREGSDDDAGRL
jgi:hypothetical protein